MQFLQPRLYCVAIAALLLVAKICLADDPLPSWNDTGPKKAIIAFVDRVTRPDSPDLVPPSERIATFDNDGTLWCEQPMYVQLAFALDRIRALAPQHPEWNEKEPFAAVLRGDAKGVAATGEKGLVELIAATHAGMTSEEFERIATDWISTARHPRFDRLYTQCTYQPMVELLTYLRANGFKTYIVSGGGIEFMRPWAERAYGIPPDQVVGSSIKLKYELRGNQPVLTRLAEIDFIDDKVGKPVGIQKLIGRRPIAAFGNSDGDYEMLRWTTSAESLKPTLALIVHHTDADREYAYDRESHFGRLDRALTESTERGWLVVDMRRDWKVVWPNQ